jgi:hypothetical protein
MKNIFTSCFLALFFMISVCTGLKSQDIFRDAAGERIQVCTDRTMYVSGENVFFSVLIFNVRDHNRDEFSRAFYCELITPDGNKIAGQKYSLQNSSGQGCLKIPEETISGIYFLKFYTRFMRNTGTDEYKYIMLKIINPLKTEVLSGKDTVDTSDLAVNKMKVTASEPSLEIISGKKIFSSREEIQLIIKKNTGKGLPAKLCLSVIPESTYKDAFIPDTNKRATAKNGVFFPETRSISLTGQVIGKESGKPIPDDNVNLSVIGDKDILVVRTDSGGRFFFALPDYHGKKDIFLCAGDLEGIKPEIRIDNDFCPRPVYLPSPLFTLNENEKKAAYRLAVNYRLSSVFSEDMRSGDTTDEVTGTSFYGEPQEVLVMEKYIDLPTLEEYFTDLPGMVRLRKVHGKKQFRYYTTDADMSLYDPLMLVDWVAVDDIDKILAMSPREIERIELVSSPYIKGNITYGGIISFVSKKKNFAGIDLPASGTFVNYSFLGKCAADIPSASSSRNIPDSRNTVYWNPDVQTNEDGTAAVSFSAPDTPGKYYILLREMGKTGEIRLTEEMIVVKGAGG